LKIQLVSYAIWYNITLDIQIVQQIFHINSMDVITIGLKFEDLKLSLFPKYFKVSNHLHSAIQSQELFLDIFV